ncbi:MAG: DedA family protein [Chlorobiales bacterium]|nr:DedA family protein [Chlorobiales bacterium]
MELLKDFIDLVLHLDRYLVDLSQQYGVWLYAILFIIIFSETGFVVTPFLPGDSLLFAVGALAATGGLDITTAIVLLSIAAILGDTLNYWFGYKFGTAFFKEDSRWLNREHLDETHRFYEKHGGKTIIIARFMPIIRTFAPFVGGIGSMTYGKFLIYNVVGGLLWIFSMIGAGYFFGNIPVVKQNFSLVILAIVGISLLPLVWQFIKTKLSSEKAKIDTATDKA